MPDGDITQDNRFIYVETPLGKDKLLLLSFSGTEEISRLFSFQLELLSLDFNINFDDIVGKNVTFGLPGDPEGTMRYFNGYVTRFAQMPGYAGYARYQAEVSPFLWFLTRVADCRIFQNKTVPDIIKQIFGDNQLHDFQDETQGSYREWEYCTQYRESACNFVMRLMEQEGIFFYFKHENGKHTLIMADRVSAVKECPIRSKFRYEENTGGGVNKDEDMITSWRHDHSMRPGKYSINDYNFKTPQLDLTANAGGHVSQGGNTNFEVFDYPGEYETKGEGETYVGIRMDEEETPHAVVAGASTARPFCAGFKFTATELFRRDQAGVYLLTSVQHNAYEGGTYPGLNGGDEQSLYSNTFTCTPISVPFRPQRLTPRPQMQGTQTAFVVGPKGEEIYVDKFGRVKVQFHWDRRGKYDEKSSCWIRVSHLWAGTGWGAVYTPRIGQEVIVDFLEGDPDRPIITGRVYNAESMPPYTLPDEMTKSTIKSYSTKGGGGFNEFRFEDKKGKEQIFLHAEKDQHDRIKNDRLTAIGRDTHMIVERDQLEKVKRDKHLAVTGDQNEKVGGTVSLSAGGDLEVKVGKNYALESGTEIHLKSGMNVVVETGTSLTLKVGGNFININPGGIFIKGTIVMLNSGGAAGSGAGAHPASPKDPLEADDAKPGEKPQLPPPKAPPIASSFSPAAMVMKQAAASGAPFCEI
jgi:type VI secretion system secreted protein VgrG